MLKLYKRTIIATVIVAVLSLAVAVLCEVVVFPHCEFVQNFAMGLLCSLIVVIVTTLLQYFYEQKRVLADYSRALRWLVFRIGLVFGGIDNIGDEFFEEIHSELKYAFNQLGRHNSELIWFSPAKRVQQENIHKQYAKIWIDFITPFPPAYREAISAIVRHQSYVPLIDAAMDFLPDGFDKESLERDKRWAKQAEMSESKQ